MKKILVSLSIVSAIAAVVAIGTTAFFSDEEKSLDNSFTAGSLDLIFQHDGSGQWTDVNGSPLFDGQSFPLNDLKPGDTGEKTVRLWVENNESCGKVSVNLTEDLDNTCTEPEQVAENSQCSEQGTNNGELNDEVEFMVWADTGCDNQYDGPTSLLTKGTITQDKQYGIGQLPTSSSTAQCYGIAYCFGQFNTSDGSCNGASVGNEAQTDSFKADLIIEALQKRHQFGSCPTGDWHEPSPQVE